MSDLDDFMAQNKPTHRSKLQPYLNDIQTLCHHGYSEPDILRYLAEKKMLAVSRKTLHAFIVKNIQSKTPTLQTTVEPSKPMDSPPDESAALPTKTSPTQTTERPKPKKGIKKFNWKNASTEGLI